MFTASKTAKFLQCNATSITGVESWPYDDGSGADLWYINGNPYRWEVTMTVSQQTHSSHRTREPYKYNGMDVNVGNWITGPSKAKAVKIISISAKSETEVTCIVEDVDRFNTFHDDTGNGLGIFGTGVCFVFELGEDGLPVLLPLPGAGILSENFSGDMVSRFRINNPIHRFRFEQTAHGFQMGDEVVMNPTTELFEKSSLDNLNVIGRVQDVSVSPDVFYLDPVTTILEDIKPPLPGNVGDIIYYDPMNPGALTATFPTSGPAKAAFIKLSNLVPAHVDGTVIGPTTALGNVLEINGVSVTFTTDPNTDNICEAQDIVDDINAQTGVHGVTAVLESPFATILGNVQNPFLEITPGSGGPVTFTISGVLITIQTDTNGFGYPTLDDFIIDINMHTGTTDVVASNENGFLRLNKTAPGGITIADVDPPTGGGSGFRQAFSDATGIPVGLTPAPTDQFINLTSSTNEIVLANITGAPMTDIGVFSVENGRLPIGLVVEQSSKKTETFVVANIPERDGLTVGVGDQVYVLNKGDGEWGHYLWDGTQFVVMATQESARTDSRSLSVDIAFNSPMTVTIGEVSSGARVSPVTIEVITPFDGAPMLSVGDVGDTSRLISDDMIELDVTGTYESQPAYQYTGGSDTSIIVTYIPNGATQGLARVTITYS